MSLLDERNERNGSDGPPATPARRTVTKPGVERQALDFVDDRFGSSRFLRSAMDKIFPDHWSFMVGEIAMYCFMILVITGIYLTLFFHPSQVETIYRGSYRPLYGQSMSEAFASTINISFDVTGGLVIRQIHHWAAIVFLAAIAFHLCRIFFTGAFRRPREVNWIVGLLLLLLSLGNGFLGYSIPDDLLSGTGLRVVFSIVESIPLIGPWLAFNVWGGAFPGHSVIFRFFILHVLLLPLAIIGLLTVHLAILWRQKHTDFPGPGKTEFNIKGSRLWPQYAFKSVGLLAIVGAVLAALGGLVQVNAIWLYGPYKPANVGEAAQPDWYVGWLDGSVRLWPHWEFRSFGHEIANPFFPGILIPGLAFTIMFAWPWIEKLVSHDYAHHNLLDRPRDRAGRTAVGAGALGFFSVLTIASASDILANDLKIPFERIIEILQYCTIFLPLAAAGIAYWTCKALQRNDVHPIQRPNAGVIVRTSSGGYHLLGHEAHGHNGNGHNENGHNGNGHDGNGHNDHAHDDHAHDGNGHNDHAPDGNAHAGKGNAHDGNENAHDGNGDAHDGNGRSGADRNGDPLTGNGVGGNDSVVVPPLTPNV